MNEVPVGILGFLTTIAIVMTLLKSRALPSIAFIFFLSTLALILVLGSYYTFEGFASLTKEGFKSTGPTTTLFVFSILFFDIMIDAGIFGVIIDQLMRLVGDSAIDVMTMTTVIVMIAYTDGASAATFLTIIPAVLPVYRKMHMRATSLLRVTVFVMSVLNLMPWAGPTMHAVSMLGMETGKLWNELLPTQVLDVILALDHAVLTSFREKVRNAGLNGKLAQTEDKVEIIATQGVEVHELTHSKLFILSILLAVAVVAMLIWDVSPSYMSFTLGVGILILVSYTDIKLQKKVLNTYAVPALLVCTTLMGAVILMGILVKNVKIDDAEIPSAVDCTSNLIPMILPAALGTHPPLVIGLLPILSALAFDMDSYFYDMLPVMMSTGQDFGVPVLPVAASMVACRNCVTFTSPMVSATLPGVGLAEVDIKDHIRTNFFYVWGFSFLCATLAIVIGIIPA